MTCQAYLCTNQLTGGNYYTVMGRLVCPECFVKLLRIMPRCAFCDAPIPYEPYKANGDRPYCDHRCATNWFITRPKKPLNWDDF